jgi:hypothetical protein
MKTIPLALLLAVTPPALLAASPNPDPAREVTLARELIEDAAIRLDDEGLRLGRERAALLAARAEAAGETKLARDAHYLVALAVYAQVYTGNNDLSTLGRLAQEGVLHADRAATLDETFGEAFTMGAANRFSLFFHGGRSPEMRNAAFERLQKGAKIDPSSTPAAFFSALGAAMDPAGPARPEGVKAYGDLAKRLDEARASSADARRPGFWDVQAHGWYAIVRLQQVRPDAAALRADLQKLIALRPDSAMTRELATRVEHRSWAPASAVQALSWKPLGSDPAGDGTVQGAPELRALDFARGADRVWFRLTYEQELPASFGANVVVDRDGDPGGDAQWWGGGSTFRFDRLITAWVVREGDGYFGLAALTDAMGAMSQRMMKLGTDVQLRIGDDGKSLLIGVPSTALGLGANAKVLAAGGSNLVWSDNLSAENGDGIPIPAQ